MARLTSGTSWGAIVNKAFPGNKRIKTGAPKIIVGNAAPGTGAIAAPVGTLYYDATNANAYICTVSTGTYVQINA